MGYYYFALAFFVLLTLYIPIFWAAGQFQDSSAGFRKGLICFMPIGLAVITFIEVTGHDWGRVAANMGYLALGSLFLAIWEKSRNVASH